MEKDVIFIAPLKVLGFFFLCLWMVPFSIFISLSANDMVLPTLDAQDGVGSGEF